MKSIVYVGMAMALLATANHSLYGQDTLRNKENGGYIFTEVKELEATSVKNQYRSGTCWSYGGSSFLESELIRMGHEPMDLSEMYIVRNTYSMKADRYIRMHGRTQFGPGGQLHDLFDVIRVNGIVPQVAYPGNPVANGKPVHNEMDAMAKAMLDVMVKNPNKKLTPYGRASYEGMLDQYLGAIPESFEYEGKKYTPQSFAESLPINWDDYVEIASFSHHPFYSTFVMNIPDNWTMGAYYNVPLADMTAIMTNAVDNGYTVGWDADVSEKGFSFKNGVAIIPDVDWNEMEKARKDTIFNAPGTELEVTQENRQEMYDNYSTTDDHLMHITGTCKDQNGKTYFIVKNSWGSDRNDAEGYIYASMPYVEAKTIAIMVHKDAIPKDIRKKMGL